MRIRRLACVCVLAVVGCAAADFSGERAPLPAGVTVTHIAPSREAIWFAGSLHNSDTARPVLYAWSKDGLREVTLLASAPVSALAVARNGEAAMLIGDRLWTGDGQPLDGTFSNVTARDGFWLLTTGLDLLYTPSLERRPETRAHLTSALTAWTATPAGDLVYATLDGALFRINHDGGAPEVVGTSIHATALAATAAGDLWIATADGALIRRRADGSTERTRLDAGTVQLAAADAAGTVYFSGPSILLAAAPSGPPARVAIEGTIHALAGDPTGGLWLSIGDTGAYRFGERIAKNNATAREAAAEPRHATPSSGITVLNITHGLVNDVVTCVVSDGRDLYFGTGYANHGDDPATPGGGVSRWNHRQFTNYTAGLPSLTVHACAYDSASGYVWFGTTAGLARFTPATGAFTTFLPGAVVQDLLVQGSSLWVATFNNGIYQLNASTGAQLSQATIGNNKVTSLAPDGQGGVWAGTSGSGLYRYTGGTATAHNASISAAALVQDLAVDASNNLWISVWNTGVYRRTPAGAFTRFTFGPVINGSIYRTYRIERTPSGDLWFTHAFAGIIGTPQGGVSVLPAAQVNSATPTFGLLSTSTGLPVNTAFSAGADADGTMWIGSSGAGAWRMGRKPGWTAALKGATHHSSPLLVDLDNDRDLEVVIGDQSGRVTALRPDGSLLWEYDTRNAVAPRTPGPMVVQSSPAAADVDGDGELEIVVGLHGMVLPGTTPGQGGVLILSRTGQFERYLSTFDITNISSPGTPEDGFNEPVFATPVLTNVDADPEPEIFVGAFDNMFYAWNGDGTPIYSRDNDGDGRFDEDFLTDFTPYTPLNSTDDAPGRKGIDDDGDGLVDEGSTSDDDEDGLVDEDYPEFPYNARDTVVASAVVADLNNDGTKEILFAHDYMGGPTQEFGRGGVLRGLTPQGLPVPGFPKGNLEQVIWSSPVVVDLDGDGTYEIAHGSGLELGTVGDTPAEQLVGRLVYAWRANGAPFIANSGGRFATTEGRSFASFAVGDLDNDGQPELVIMTTSLMNKSFQFTNAAGAVVPESQAIGQQLYAFRSNGTLMPGFPVRPHTVRPATSAGGSPVLADVDGDGFLDIIQPVGQGLMIFDRQGRVLPGCGLFESLQDDTFAGEISSTPAVADINLDGVLDVVWSAGPVVRMISLGPANATYNRSWPQWRRAVNRNAIFGPIVSVVQGHEASNSLEMNAQVFGARSSISTVSANLSSLGGPASLSLASSNNAYYRAAHNTSALAPGRYAIPITATDTAGRQDMQTLFFVKRASTRQLSVGPGSLAFGAVVPGETAALQVTVVNIGNAPVTVHSVTSSNPEFTVASPAFPQVLQPLGTALVTVRFRPGAAGARTATLSISSDDAVAPVRTVAMTASSSGTGGGCTLSLAGAPSGTLPATRQSGTFTLQTSPAGCAWTATSNAPWIQVYPLSGAGQTTIYYTVFPNFSTQTRSGAAVFNSTVWNVTQSANTATPDQRFVAAMYFAFFGRTASAPDITFHINSLPAIGRAGLVWNFMNSPEFNLGGRFIAGLYVGILNRDAEYGGWLFQRNALTSGQAGPSQLVQNFLSSAEYAQRFGAPSNDEFVRLLYRYILLREASPAEVAFQSSQLAPGATTRANLASLFLSSNEFRLGTGPRLTAFLLYALILQRDPSGSERAAAMGRITDEASVRTLIAELLGSGEFAGLLQ